MCFHAFLAVSVDFKPQKENLYVTFGPERDNWSCKMEGRMNLAAYERYLYVHLYECTHICKQLRKLEYLLLCINL